MASTRNLVKELDAIFGMGTWEWKTIEKQIELIANGVREGVLDLDQRDVVQKSVIKRFDTWAKKHTGEKICMINIINQMKRELQDRAELAKTELNTANLLKKSKAKHSFKLAQENLAELRAITTAFLAMLPDLVQARDPHRLTPTSHTEKQTEVDTAYTKHKGEGPYAPPPPYNPRHVPPADILLPVFSVDSGVVSVEKQGGRGTAPQHTRPAEEQTHTHIEDPFHMRKHHETLNASQSDLHSSLGSLAIGHNAKHDTQRIHRKQTLVKPSSDKTRHLSKPTVLIRATLEGHVTTDDESDHDSDMTEDDDSVHDSSLTQAGARAEASLNKTIHNMEQIIIAEQTDLELAHRALDTQTLPTNKAHSLRRSTRTRNPPERYTLAPEPDTMCPLVATTTGVHKYVPLSLTDAQTLVDQLPPLSSGAAAWLRKMDSLTGGITLALGDFRNILKRSTTSIEAAEVERQAQTYVQPNNDPFHAHSQRLTDVMREMWPTRAASTIPSYTWDEKLNPGEYMGKAVEDWTNTTGVHPARGQQVVWFRNAILKGLPNLIKDKIEEDPDMGSDKPHDQWVRTVLFHMNKHKVKMDATDKETIKMERELLKTQLAEARKTINNNKVKQTPDTMMPVTAPQQPQTFMNTQTYIPAQSGPTHTPPYTYGPAPYFQQHPYTGGRGRGGEGWRRRDRRRLGACLRCGAMGHWAAQCTAPPAPEQAIPHPHQAPNSQQAPRQHPAGQYSVEPWGGR
ncbi:uncharacterized protein LOC125801122 [Astyanax mexicanus]|uniref:uncharacterized protein LOC125801122 n=1 Tax=Astyanax mexicanus TaxID=7994 RepID=UPI0020CB4629|nr:uncharacterized protein LOC125801122 [Astyanax mexicanus]